MIDLAGRLQVPCETAALLWDMDGVLLDTLTLDFEVVGGLLAKYAPAHPGVSRAQIRANFAYSPPDFFVRILSAGEVTLSATDMTNLLDEYESIRRAAVPAVHVGVVETLQAALAVDIRTAVVSNNVLADIEQMLENVALRGYFEVIVGNDKAGMRKKPAPDPYLEGCALLDLDPSVCVVIEDSLLGAQAGHHSGCYTVGVATGANDLSELAESHYVSKAQASFALPSEVV